MQKELQGCGQETAADVRLSAINVLTAVLSLTASWEYQYSLWDQTCAINMCTIRSSLSESRLVFCSVHMKPLTSVTLIFPPSLHSCGHVSNPFKAVCAFCWGKKRRRKEGTLVSLMHFWQLRSSVGLCSPGRLGVVDSTKWLDSQFT